MRRYLSYRTRFANLSFLISCLDAVQPFDSYVAHLVGDRMVSVASHTVHTGSDSEVRAKLLSLAKQFIDVALSIPNVHAAIRVFEKCRGLPEVLQPSNTLLGFDRHASWIGLVQCMTPYEFLAAPKFDCCKSQRQPFRCHRETRVHQDPANRTCFGLSIAAVTGLHSACKTDQLRLFSLIGKFRGVLQNQDRTLGFCKALARRLKMPGEDISLVHALVGEKSIRGFSIRPVLTGHRNTLPVDLTRFGGHLMFTQEGDQDGEGKEAIHAGVPAANGGITPGGTPV